MGTPCLETLRSFNLLLQVALLTLQQNLKNGTIFEKF